MLPAWQTAGEPANFWQFVGNLPEFRREVPDTQTFWWSQGPNFEDGATLILVAAGAGLAVYWIGRRRLRPVEAADYKEAPGGALSDGRVDPSAR